MRKKFMAGLINSLIENIKEQTGFFNELSALSDEKKQMIIQNDVEGLRGIVKQENAIVPKALKVEKNREQIMKDIATVLNKNFDDLTFSSLAELIQAQPEHPAFVAAFENFIMALDEMKQKNDENKILIADALEYIDFNMNVIHSSMDAQPAGYGDLLDSGQEPGSFIDTRS